LQTKEAAMFLPKSDIFKDIRQEAINEISEIAYEEKHETGAVLFMEGDPAIYTYVLVEGKVLLTTDDAAAPRYVATEMGDLFGWSSAVGRDFYSATAECLAPSTVLKLDKSDLERVFDEHPRSGKVFYRLLAEALGQRWIDLNRRRTFELV
jgi:CRP-like cAMP-binding protein